MISAGAQARRRWGMDRSLWGALFLSTLLHLMALAIVEIGRNLDWWDRFDLKQVAEKTPARKENDQEIELKFVEVDPLQETVEPPENPKFYAARNSQAANPEPSPVELNQPKIEGTQDKVFQTVDRPRPSEPKPEEVPEKEKTPEKKPAQKPQPLVAAPEGLLARNNPSPELKEEPKPVEKPQLEIPKPAPRPRTLAAARQRQGLIAGPKIKQEGGANRVAIEASVDAKATLFGAYDQAIIAAVQKRWYDLLDERDYVRNYSGKVVLEFELRSDGRITGMRVSENQVSEILALICQRAILDPAPYAPWPSDLRRLVGEDHRDVRFTFYYH